MVFFYNLLSSFPVLLRENKNPLSVAQVSSLFVVSAIPWMPPYSFLWCKLLYCQLPILPKILFITTKKHPSPWNSQVSLFILWCSNSHFYLDPSFAYQKQDNFQRSFTYSNVLQLFQCFLSIYLVTCFLDIKKDCSFFFFF